jgi:predicted glycosyl hydrolase (DUF1957 family)
MITNFEEITASLTEEEKDLIRVLVLSFSKRTAENPIKAPEIVKSVNDYLERNNKKQNFNEVRLRKSVNYIRVNGIIPLIATSNGYYTSYNRAQIVKQIESLRERASAILACADGLNKFLTPR